MSHNRQNKPTEQIPSNIRIGYFTVKTNNGNGYVCVALKRPPKESNSSEYSAGFDFCSPKDTFVKQRAYTTAVKRLNRCASPSNRANRVKNNHIIPYIEFTSVAEFSSKTFVKALLLTIAKGNAPGWLIRAFNRGDVFPGLDKKTNPISPENSSLVSKQSATRVNNAFSEMR